MEITVETLAKLLELDVDEVRRVMPSVQENARLSIPVAIQSAYLLGARSALLENYESPSKDWLY